MEKEERDVKERDVKERDVGMKTYNVTAKRWDHGWELHIEGVGVTQSRGVSDAEMMVRDYLRLDGVAEPFNVVIKYRDGVTLQTRHTVVVEVETRWPDHYGDMSLDEAVAYEQQREQAATNVIHGLEWSGADVTSEVQVMEGRS